MCHLFVMVSSVTVQTEILVDFEADTTDESEHSYVNSIGRKRKHIRRNELQKQNPTT